MTKLDIYHGLLGSGKTTLIKKMLETAYKGYRVAIIENEIGKVNLDAGEFDTSIEVKELTSGCVCCSVKGDFTRAIRMLLAQQKLDYIIIEPTGAADIVALRDACLAVSNITQNRHIMVVNAKKIIPLLQIVGPFFTEQLLAAETVYLNFTEKMETDAIEKAKDAICSINAHAELIDTPLAQITAETFSDQNVENSASLTNQTETSSPETETTETDSSVLIQEKEASVVSHKRKRKASVQLVVEEAERVSAKPIRMATGKQQKILTWSYDFQTPFTEEGFQKLQKILLDTQMNEIWRAKGLLPMQNHTVKKVDAVFGDLFEEDRDATEEQRTGTLVLIGKTLQISWLETQFAEIEAYNQSRLPAAD